MVSLINRNKIAKYFDECIVLYDVESGIKTIDHWVNKTEHLSGKFLDKDERNKFKGDMFEIFSEMFFNIFEADNSVGVREYEPIQSDEDYGVDAIGINVNNNACAVQIKYRANPLPECYITYEDMSKTYSAAREYLNISLDNANTLYLFTTSGGVTISCDKVLRKKLRVINRNIISGFIDNNCNFWLKVFNEVEKTFKELGAVV